MEILHLTLKKKWFDMIASGEKKEEYREIKKYWASRLSNGIETYLTQYLPKGYGYKVNWKKFDAICFHWGYKKDHPSFLIECKGIDIGKAKSEWSDNWQGEVFVIKLGEIIKSKKS